MSKRHGGFFKFFPRAFSVFGKLITHGLFGCPEDQLVINHLDRDESYAWHKCTGCTMPRKLAYCKHEYGFIPGGETGYVGVCKMCKHMKPAERGSGDLEEAIKNDESLQKVAKLREERGL